MHFFSGSLWIFSVALPIFGNHIKETNWEIPMNTHEESPEKFSFEDPSSRQKRDLSSSHQIVGCDIFVEKRKTVYTLKNNGKAGKCAIMAAFPVIVKMLAINVGVQKGTEQLEEQTGTINQCRSRLKGKDFLKIGTSKDLKTSNMVPHYELCGWDTAPDIQDKVLGCGMPVVELISSGEYNNTATFNVNLADDEYLKEAFFKCRT